MTSQISFYQRIQNHNQRMHELRQDNLCPDCNNIQGEQGRQMERDRVIARRQRKFRK